MRDSYYESDEGWGGYGRKAHYFRGLHALCAYPHPEFSPPYREQPDDDDRDNCKKCQQKRRAEKRRIGSGSLAGPAEDRPAGAD